jgi:hypothetical protein
MGLEQANLIQNLRSTFETAAVVSERINEEWKSLETTRSSRSLNESCVTNFGMSLRETIFKVSYTVYGLHTEASLERYDQLYEILVCLGFNSLLGYSKNGEEIKLVLQTLNTRTTVLELSFLSRENRSDTLLCLLKDPNTDKTVGLHLDDSNQNCVRTWIE